MEKKYRILIVDDILVNRMLIKEIVKDIGSKLFEASNGKAAIDIFEQEEVDIILMDIEMPIMNGIETTKYIRLNFSKSKRSVPIIALTAHNPNSFSDELQNAGFNFIMTKPYSVDKVLKLIEEVCS